MARVMDTFALVKSIYLGDRACKAVILDGSSSSVRLHVDVISRIRSASGQWEFYSDEDIVDGFVVFEAVESVWINNNGHLPNDEISSIECEQRGDGRLEVRINLGSVDVRANYHEANIQLVCRSIYLEDPNRPGVEIRS